MTNENISSSFIRFTEVCAAYVVLMDPVARSRHDRNRRDFGGSDSGGYAATASYSPTPSSSSSQQATRTRKLDLQLAVQPFLYCGMFGAGLWLFDSMLTCTGLFARYLGV